MNTSIRIKHWFTRDDARHLKVKTDDLLYKLDRSGNLTPIAVDVSEKTTEQTFDASSDRYNEVISLTGTALDDSLTGNARRIERVDDIEEDWLADVGSVGITSAASTPEELVQEIVSFFRSRNPDLELIEEGEWEEITFRQPKRLPPSSPV